MLAGLMAYFELTNAGLCTLLLMLKGLLIITIRHVSVLTCFLLSKGPVLFCAGLQILLVGNPDSCFFRLENKLLLNIVKPVFARKYPL